MLLSGLISWLLLLPLPMMLLGFVVLVFSRFPILGFIIVVIFALFSFIYFPFGGSPDCKHPATAEDFLTSTPSSSSKVFFTSIIRFSFLSIFISELLLILRFSWMQLLRSVSVSKLIGLADWTRRYLFFPFTVSRLSNPSLFN